MRGKRYLRQSKALPSVPSSASPRGEGFTLQAYRDNDPEFMKRAMNKNRSGTPPRQKASNSAEAELERVKEFQRKFHRGIVGGLGLIAVYRQVDSVLPTGHRSADARMVDAGYGYAGIHRRGTQTASIEIGGIFGSDTPLGRPDHLIARCLLEKLCEREGRTDMEVTDETGSLLFALAVKRSVHEWSHLDGMGRIGDYDTIDLEFPTALKGYLRVGQPMNARIILGKIEEAFPDMPPYEYQDHTGSH